MSMNAIETKPCEKHDAGKHCRFHHGEATSTFVRGVLVDCTCPDEPCQLSRLEVIELGEDGDRYLLPNHVDDAAALLSVWLWLCNTVGACEADEYMGSAASVQHVWYEERNAGGGESCFHMQSAERDGFAAGTLVSW